MDLIYYYDTVVRNASKLMAKKMVSEYLHLSFMKPNLKDSGNNDHFINKDYVASILSLLLAFEFMNLQGG